MQTAIKSVASAALAGSAILASGFAAQATEARTARPAQGIVLDVGSKHTVSYFVSDGGKCNMTLMVGEKADGNGENSSVGARFRVGIDAGKVAVVETAEGKSLEFTCAPQAKAMSVRMLDIVAYRGGRS